jgi:preprotein translocase subunit SecE
MARNRQRAKDRKQRQQGDPDAGPAGDAPQGIDPAIAGGAPPEDVGQRAPHVDFDDDAELDDDVELDDDAGAVHSAELVPGEAAAPPAKRSGFRAVTFVRACWAELQRVQWPDRRQVGQATAVVLGFVVIAGAFLGLADVVAQRVVNFIL